MLNEADLQGLVGYRLPGGVARIQHYEDWLLRDALGAPPPAGDGMAHPTMVFLAAQANIGIELEELFALFGATSADGPMLGEWSVDCAEPLRLLTDYAVSCTVERVVRKEGKRTGVFDLVTVVIELTGPDDRVHATVRPTYVFPRKGV